jgi:hypothetical protein
MMKVSVYGTCMIVDRHVYMHACVRECMCMIIT